ncbi:MAG: VOC family protein [Actinomycetota bacterium]
MDPPFEQLDYLYIPSTDVAADAKYFTEVLGGRHEFSIDDGGTRVAMVRMTEDPPALLFTDHLEGERTIFIYRVASLRKSLKELADRGWEKESTFEIPQGPCCSFTSPDGQRVALYQRTRPDVESHFLGRFDF